MYRVVAADLDGTLLRSDKTVSEETIGELRRITEKGVFFIPSTGRTHRELPEALRKLPFLRYALCCNGGAVYDYLEQRKHYSWTKYLRMKNGAKRPKPRKRFRRKLNKKY